MTKRPIYYDTETTGVSPAKDRIIEIAAYDPVQDRTFESLINPGCPIPPEATAIHKITDEMVADAPSFEEVAKQFTAFCTDDMVLIAHNNDSFDKPFIQNEFQRNNVPFPSWPFIDSLKFSRKYRPDLPRHSLQHLREYHGIEANNAHRALDDVIVLHKVFSLMIDDLNMDTIIALMAQKQTLRHMPFGKHRGTPLKDMPPGYVRWLHENGALDKPDNLELKEAFASFGMLPN
jgi:DNA polymerase-3 subunit epsilon